MAESNLKDAAARYTGEGAPPSPEPVTPTRATSTERVRRHRERKRAEGKRGPRAKPDPMPLEIVVGPEEHAEAAYLGAVVWDLALVPFLKLKPLTDPQKDRLGGALAPIIKKYMPVLGDWQYEVAAALTVAALIRETWPDPPPPEEDAEATSDAPAPGA